MVTALKKRFKKLGVEVPKAPFEDYLRRIFGRNLVLESRLRSVHDALTDQELR